MDGDTIRRLREQRGLTQQQLAQAIGVGQRTIGNWERGETVPKNRIGRLEDFFGVNRPESDNPLGDLSDIALLTELLRRAVDRQSRAS